MAVLERMDPFLSDFDRLTQRVLGPTAMSAAAVMPMDVVRTGDDILVKFDLPGVDPSSVDITLDRRVLTVSAQHGADYGEDAKVLVRERPTGEVTRRVTLGEWVDAEHIQASYDNGVLSVRIPVGEHAKPRKIEIQHGSAKQISS